MELKINLQTANSLVDFVRFFSKTNLEFIPSDEDTFLNLLYEAICSGSVLPSWLNKPIFQNYLSKIELAHPDEQQLQRFIINVKGYSKDQMIHMREPTEYFKTFCGSESLNEDGLLTKKMALDFIIYQLPMRNVKVVDGTIYMNEYLNSLFNTSLVKIRHDELIDLIDTLFI